jgi:alpha-tubulin suppressor-like RCC1 family protein
VKRIALLGIVVASLVAPVPGFGNSSASGAIGTSFQEPYSWGAVATGSSVYGQYSAPVTGSSTLSTSAPAGGGTLGARVNSGAPVSKFAQLQTFGGGTPQMFSKGGQAAGTGTHMLVAVENTSGAFEVWGWGKNTYGQLGNGTSTDSSRPVKATWTAGSGEEIIALAVGERHSLMLTLQGSTRRVYAWGSNAQGQVGGAGLSVTTSSKQTAPLHISSLTSHSIRSIAAGRYHSVAADSGGEVWVWGYDLGTYGNIGLPGEKSRFLPEKLTTASMGQRQATVTQYAIKNNVATLTSSSYHYFETSKIATVSIGNTLLDGSKTVSAVSNTTFSFTAQPDVTSTASVGSIVFSNSSATVTNKRLLNNEAILTVNTGHNLQVGNIVTVDVGDPVLDGTRTISSVTSTTVKYVMQANVSSTAVSPAGSVTAVSPSTNAPTTVSNKVLSNNLATITVPTGHGYGNGNVIAISGVGSGFDGEQTITSTTATTITFKSQDDIASATVTGTIDIRTPTFATTHKAISSNVATLTVPSGHGVAIGNVLEVSGLGGNFDGSKTVTAVSATTVSYKAQIDVATTAVSGTATIIDCTSACPTVPSGVQEVAAGNGFTLARTSSSVLSWGYTSTNNYNRIGRVSTGVTTPDTVALPVGCTPSAITAAPYGGAVLCTNNSIATWGDNRYGQLGTNTAVTTTSRSTPMSISGISLNAGESISSIDMSFYNGMALTSTGRLYTWGGNQYRLLGNTKTYAGTTSSTAVPNSLTAQLATRISPSGATVVAATYEFATGFILDSNGQVWTWGWVGNGMTGRGVTGLAVTSTGANFYPLGIGTSVRIALMDSTYYGMTAVLSDGSMWTMGAIGTSSGYYYTGDGTSAARFNIGRIDLPFGPDTSATSETITQLSCGTYHCLIATSAGKIYGWGDSSSRNVVINSTADKTTPTLIASGLTNPRIAAGHSYSLYVDVGASGTGGTVYAYGSNANRRSVPQVSTNPLTSATAVQDVITPTGTPNDVVAISVGTAHSIALRADGTLMSWGSNTYGQLGNGTNSSTTYYAEPVLPGGKIAASIHAAGNHTIVRATDGSLVGWGSNLNGVLSGAASGNVLSPTNIASGYSFSQVDTYGYSTSSNLATAVGIATDGTVFAWGSNRFGQLGRTDRAAASSGVNLYSATPVVVQTSNVANLTNADKVVATGFWSAAYRTYVSPQVPSEPQTVAVVSNAASSITASWTAPTSPRDLEGYVVEVLRAGSVVFRAGAGRGATSLDMTTPTFDIVNGAEHTVRVYAVNEAGESAASNSATATPVGVSSAPRNLDVVPLVNGLRVSFATPSDLAGLPILDYQIVSTPTSGSAVTTTVPVGSSPYSIDVTSLTVGTRYVVTVKARNAEGLSAAATSSVVIPGRPTVPQSVVALGLDAAAEVSWDEPESDGGETIRSYLIRVYADGGTVPLSTTLVNSSLASAMSETITGLTNGTRYEFSVTASQEVVGTQYFGLESERSEIIAGRPAAVTSVTATAANLPTGTQVLVTWNKVADQTGVAVTHYRVNRKTTGAYTNGTASTSASVCVTNSCSATVTGLTNGTEYTFVVEAGISNAAWGLASSEVIATPIGRTSAPSITVTSMDSGTVVEVIEPTSLNGSAVTHYELMYQTSPGGSWSAAIELEPREFPYTIQSLTNGTSYLVSVLAVNGAGDSDADSATVVPATTPGAPSNVSARPGSIIVAWDAPIDTGGETISAYEITVTDPDGVSTTFATSPSNPTGTSSCTTAGRSCTITQVFTADSPETLVTVPDDIQYTIAVTALNAAGSGPPSSNALVVTGQPDAPTNLVATVGIESFEMCWTKPSGALTSYQINATRGSTNYALAIEASEATTSATCSSPKVGYTVTEWSDGSLVEAGQTYSVTVVASVSASDYIYGSASAAVSAEPFGLPGASVISSVQVTTTSATVTWSAADPRGSTITRYVAQAVGTGLSCIWSTGALSCVINGLESDTNYTFNVIASNAVGDGLPSESETARTSRVSDASQSPTTTNVVSATSTTSSSTTLSSVQAPSNLLVSSTSTTVQAEKTPGSTTSGTTSELEIVASGTTTGENNAEEDSSDQLPTEQVADTGISLEITDELLLILLCCIALVAIAFAVRMLSNVKQK